MSIDVTVVFHGLCAFIPDKPFGNPAEPPENVSVLMPEFTGGGSVGDTPVEMHTPLLVAENSILGLHGPGRSALSVRGMDLRFESDLEDRLAVDDDVHRTRLTAIQWVADAREIGPPAFSKVHSHLVTDSDLDPRRVAARLSIKRGKLTSWKTDAAKMLRIQNRDLIPLRAYATFVALALRGAEYVKVHGRPHRGSEKELLKVTRNCELHFGNLCSDELMHLLVDKPWCPKETDDTDFAGHFLLSSAWPIDPREPMPYPVDDGGGGGVKCRKIVMTL